MSTDTQAPYALETVVTEEEVFFLDAVVRGAGKRVVTEPLPQILAPVPAPRASIEPQRVVMVQGVTEVPPPPKTLPIPPTPDSTVRLPAMAAVQAASVAPPLPKAPIVNVPRHVPVPRVAPRRGLHPAAVWLVLAACTARGLFEPLEHDVAGLDVAVDHARVVRDVEAAEHLLDERHQCRGLEDELAPQPDGQSLPVEPPVRDPVARPTAPRSHDLRDELGAQLLCHRGLSLEAHDQVEIVGERLVQELHRELVAVRVYSRVDRPGRALAEQLAHAEDGDGRGGRHAPSVYRVTAVTAGGSAARASLKRCMDLPALPGDHRPPEAPP